MAVTNPPTGETVEFSPSSPKEAAEAGHFAAEVAQAEEDRAAALKTDWVGARQALAAARIALRACQDAHEVQAAYSEKGVIAAAGDEKALGVNAEARGRNLLLGVDADPEFQASKFRLREAQEELDIRQAQIDSMEDVRRDVEWRIRQELLDVVRQSGCEKPTKGESGFTAIATQEVELTAFEIVAANTPRGVSSSAARDTEQADINDLFPF